MQASLILAAALLAGVPSLAWPAGAARGGLGVRIQPGRLSLPGVIPSAAAIPGIAGLSPLSRAALGPLAAAAVQSAPGIGALLTASPPVLPAGMPAVAEAALAQMAAEAPKPVLEPLRQAWSAGISSERIFDNSSRLQGTVAESTLPTTGRWRSAARWIAERFRTQVHIHRFASPPAPAISPFLSELDGAALTFSAMTPLRGTILKGLKGIFGARGGLSASLKEERRFLYSVYTLTVAGPAFMVEAALRDVDDWFAYLEWS